MKGKMKSGLNISLFLLTFSLFSNEAFSLTNYQIKRYCSKEKRLSSCIKDLQEKRYNLQQGKLIEIPVLPYKKN